MSIVLQNQVAPICSVIGDALTGVDYWILESDTADFVVDRPNASGLAAISLRFGSRGLEITWNWEPSLLTDGAAYHLNVTQTRRPELAGLWNLEGLSRLPAIASVPWCSAKGKDLQAVDLLGWDASPQAVRFVFASSAIIVATGHPGHTLNLGDCDDLLVFSEREWTALMEGETQRWHQLWSASTPVRPAFAVIG